MKKIIAFLLLLNSAFCKAQTEDYYGPVTISFHGFVCNRPTNDDPLGGDGVGDEVRVHFWNQVTPENNRASYNNMAALTYGENFLLPDRVKAGTATINGGIKAGDSYYREAVSGDNDPNILTKYAIINTVCSQNTLITILPTIWEYDKGAQNVPPLLDFWTATSNAFNDMAIRQQIRDFSTTYTYNDNNPYGFFLAGRHIGLDAKYGGLFTANKNKLASRPIGLFPNWDFSSAVIVLTPKTIKIIAEKDYGYGKGILPVHFNEESLGNSFGHGNYILLLRIVADIKKREPNNPAPPPAPHYYSVGIKVNNAAVGEEFKFQLKSGAILDSVTVRNPNTTTNFSTKIAAGQQYIISQLSGRGNCQINNSSGIISRDTIITANCDALPSSVHKLSVGYATSLMPVNDKYVLELTGKEQLSEKIIIDSGHKTASFLTLLHTGDSFLVRLKTTPRPASLNWNGTPDSVVKGVVGNSDISLLLSCPFPMTIYKINVTGIESGERFNFADSYRRSYSIPLSTTISMGGFPVGDPMMIKQTGGPRPCIITPNSGIVPSSPNNPIIIQCNCSKKPKEGPPPTPPKNTYDLVTRSSDDKILNTYYESWNPVVGGKGEDEGRYVAFSMYGKGIDGSTGNYRQVFWRDRKLGVTKLVSKSTEGKEGDGNSALPAISADGKSVAFESYAKNICDGDINGGRDVFIWNEATNSVKLVSKSIGGGTANGESTEPVINGDGTVIAYTSQASNIVRLEPVFSTPNVYVYDVNSGSTVFITKDYETGKAVGGYSPTISDDGTKVAFCAFTYRLTANDKNNLWDIFLWQAGKPGLKRISMTEAGGERNQGSESSSRVVYPALSGNGEYIAFATTSSDIVLNDNNQLQDIFLYNTSTSAIKRVSRLNNTTEGDGDSPISQGEKVGISYDGTWIAYNTNATNFGVAKGNIVVQNTETGKIIPITKIIYGSTARPMLSRYGNYVVAGCSEPYDKRFSSSGIFAIYTNIGACNTCNE